MGGYFDEVEYGKAITKQVGQLLSGHPSRYIQLHFHCPPSTMISLCDRRYKGARAILANTPIVHVMIRSKWG